MYKIFLGILVLLLGVSVGYCKESDHSLDGWQHIENQFFDFFIPPDMTKINVKGIDSYVGSFKNDKIKLNFDYGMYSDPLNYIKLKDYKEHTEKIGQWKAKIVTYEKSNTLYVMAVHFSKAGSSYTDGAKLTIYSQCSGAVDYETALKIFRSIKFKS